ncbi:hypothetical protein VTK26DRAFT_1499 [Humicola hyalothermophila]
MTSNVHPKTLFHLVPVNQLARDALLHPDNQRFVSKSEKGPGLEVGYHVPSLPGGHVITRLGRNADLILRKSTPEQPLSAVHVAFEVNPSTMFVLLSVRSKRVSSVTFCVHGEAEAKEEAITGDGVILYGQNYSICIGPYMFLLVWRTISSHHGRNVEGLKRLVMDCYESSKQRLRELRSRDRPTEVDASEALSWHITRLNTTKGPSFQDIPHLRTEIGGGAFGTVYAAVDQKSGHVFAIKVVDLTKLNGSHIETARAWLHREIKIMGRVKHPHIIELLGHQHFDTTHPEIFMPRREGTLTKLVYSPSLVYSYSKLCHEVLEQMLSALDYLANEKLVHRDVKPDNILYATQGNRYLFQLADFGLANYLQQATTFCGTGYFQAPEFRPDVSGIRADQSPKVDVWSLCATIIAVISKFQKYPPATNDYGVIMRALQTETRAYPDLLPMVRLHPDYRASAAQMLVSLYEGRGLTTPVSRVPPLGPDGPSPPAVQSRPGPAAAPPQRPAASPLIVYPPRRRPQPSRNRLRMPAQQQQQQQQQQQPLPPPYSPGPGRGGNLGQPAILQAQQTRAQRDGVSKRRPNHPSSGSNGAAKGSAAGEKATLAPARPSPVPGMALPVPGRAPVSGYERMPGSFVE